jgi:hypothetical protein
MTESLCFPMRYPVGMIFVVVTKSLNKAFSMVFQSFQKQNHDAPFGLRVVEEE